jgi:hypothetical protein
MLDDFIIGRPSPSLKARPRSSFFCSDGRSQPTEKPAEQVSQPGVSRNAQCLIKADPPRIQPYVQREDRDTPVQKVNFAGNWPERKANCGGRNPSLGFVDRIVVDLCSQ